MPDFDQCCILLAVILTVASLRQFRLINLVLLSNFLLFELSSYFILSELAGRQSMILHAVYVVISGITVMLLVKLKASPPLFLATFLFSVYNLAIVGEFIFYGSVGFFDNFKAVASSQMIIELLIMFATGLGGLYVCRGLHSKSDYISLINHFFRAGIRLGNQRLT